MVMMTAMHIMHDVLAPRYDMVVDICVLGRCEADDDDDDDYTSSKSQHRRIWTGCNK